MGHIRRSGPRHRKAGCAAYNATGFSNFSFFPCRPSLFLPHPLAWAVDAVKLSWEGLWHCLSHVSLGWLRCSAPNTLELPVGFRLSPQGLSGPRFYWHCVSSTHVLKKCLLNEGEIKCRRNCVRFLRVMGVSDGKSIFPGGSWDNQPNSSCKSFQTTCCRPSECPFVEDVTYPQRFTWAVVFEIARAMHCEIWFALRDTEHVEIYTARFLTWSPRFCLLFVYLTQSWAS